jgi:N-acetylneuraminic acid mutarotase
MIGLVTCAGANASGGPSFSWHPAADMPVGKGGHACGVLRGKVLSVGGTHWTEGQKLWSGDLDLYDPATNTWSQGPGLPFAVAYGAFAVVNGRLLICGGSDGTRDYRDTLVCVPYGKSYEWLRGPALPAPRVYASAAAIGPRLYVVAGAPDNRLDGKLYNDVLAVNTAHPEEGWQALRAMPGPGRTLPAVAALEGNLYVFGGYAERDGAMVNLDDAIVYETAHDRWRRLPDLPYPMRGCQALAIQGKVYLFGGYVKWPAVMMRPESFTEKILCFDPITEAYTEVGELPLAAIGMNPLLLPDGRVFICGGEDRKQHRTEVSSLGTLSVR